MHAGASAAGEAPPHGSGRVSGAAELPPSWAALQRASAVTGKARLADSTVDARRVLLNACLRDLARDSPCLLAHPAALAFFGIAATDLPPALHTAVPAPAGSQSAHDQVVAQAHRMFLGSYGAVLEAFCAPGPGLLVCCCACDYRHPPTAPAANSTASREALPED